jgi:hypothetical protein
MKHLEFKVREQDPAFSEFPEYRIDKEDGCTVATIHGSDNQDLGRIMAAAPELLAFVKHVLAEQLANGTQGDADYISRATRIVNTL